MLLFQKDVRFAPVQSKRAVKPTGTFPREFLWGTGTAAHQVEGHNPDSDWWEWERAGGKIKNNDSSAEACGWWQGRYREDLLRARSLGHNTHRLSIEWSRLEPRRGEWNWDAVRVYRDMLITLRDLGMTPLVTLHHFTNPRWLSAEGGWENPAVVDYFERYASFAVRQFGDLCSFWLTLNEPNVYATLSYCAGLWPPGKKGITRALRVGVQMVRAHAAAYHAMKKIQPKSQIGIAHRFQTILPARTDSALDRMVATVRDRLFNWLIFNAIETGKLPFGLDVSRARGTQDFIGVNYYFSERAAFDLREAGALFARRVLEPCALQHEPTFSGVGNIDPASLELLLHKLAVYQKPIYITENGIFESDQGNQSRYLVSHLAAVQRAQAAGVEVRGYYWWTLVDNFEWSEGYAPRFGLYRLDRSTQNRIAKPIADAYARVIRENEISAALLADYQDACW